MLQQIQQQARTSLIALVLLVSGLPVSTFAQLSTADQGKLSPTPRLVSEANLSAALTLRIAKFIEWPERPSITGDKPYFIVGVMGTAQTGSAFTQFDGNLVKGKTLKTVRITPAMDQRDLRRCHIIFVDASGDQNVIAEMTRLSKGILTVFGPDSSERGDPCLRLVKENDKLAFDIDLQCTRRSELNLDAGLIGLAREVIK